MKNGTTFTAHDITQILDSCSKNGVLELVLGEIKVSFIQKPVVESIFVPHTGEVDAGGVVSPAAMPKSIDREDFLQQLLVEDPLGFEQEMMRPENNNS